MDKQLIQKAKQIDILSLVSQHTNLQKVASTNGGEYAGPCPKCQGVDRFRVQPNNSGGGIWFCRKCIGEKWSDAIAFQQFVTGQNFLDAVHSLNNGSTLNHIKMDPKTKKDDPLMLKPEWQKRAKDLIDYAKENLYTAGNKTIIKWREKDINTGEVVFRNMTPLEYLFSRGLDLSTIRLWDLGYIPKNLQDDPGEWGLSGKDIWIPQGILIPCKSSNLVWYLKIRRPREDPKYIQIRGSSPALYMVESLEFSQRAIICEGELDALLLWQRIEDLAGVISLGSMSNKIDFSTWWSYLLPIKKFLTAYDNDQAGIAGRMRLNISVEAHIEIPKLTRYSKDITDYFRAGGDLRSLIKKYL